MTCQHGEKSANDEYTQLSSIYRNKTKTKQETLQHTKTELARKHSEKMCKQKTGGYRFLVIPTSHDFSALFSDPSLIPVNMSLVGGEVGFGVVVTGTWASPQWGNPQIHWGYNSTTCSWFFGPTLVRDSLSKGFVTPSSGFPCLVFWKSLGITATFEKSTKSESQLLSASFILFIYGIMNIPYVYFGILNIPYVHFGIL